MMGWVLLKVVEPGLIVIDASNGDLATGIYSSQEQADRVATLLRLQGYQVFIKEVEVDNERILATQY